MVEGDVISLAPERHSKRVRHVVDTVLAPFGKPLSERPPILTEEERKMAQYDKRKFLFGRQVEKWKDYFRLESEMKGRPIKMSRITHMAEERVIGGFKPPTKTIDRGKEVFKDSKEKFPRANHMRVGSHEENN